MKETEQPSSRRTGRADAPPARIPLYCFHCRYTFEATIPARDAPVNREAENSAGAALPACPRCRRRTDLYRIHRL